MCRGPPLPMPKPWGLRHHAQTPWHQSTSVLILAPPAAPPRKVPRGAGGGLHSALRLARCRGGARSILGPGLCHGTAAAVPLHKQVSFPVLGVPHPPAPCGSLCCFTENVMTRQPLSFQACFQLLGGETFCSCFWVWNSGRLRCRGDRPGALASPADSELSLRPRLRWHDGTGVATRRARNEQLLPPSTGGC